MTAVVLDASVVLKWFAGEERGAPEARRLRDDYATGRLTVVAPPLLFLEVVNVAGRRWRWSDAALRELATSLEEIAFDIGEAALPSVAVWVGRGLTAYDAAYVALAEERGLPLISDDSRILEAAPAVSRPLV